MHNGTESIHFVAVKQNVNLNQIGTLGAIRFIVQRRIAASARLELVKEVKDDFCQGQGVVHFHAGFAQVVHA